MNNKMLCYCKHDCARCTTYRATADHNDDLRRQAQKFYREEFGREIPIDQIHCTGGRTEGIFHLCRECPWMKCCKERGLKACSECSEYPCPPLAEYIGKYENQCNQIE